MDFAGEVALGEGFREEVHVGVEDAAVGDDIGGIPGHEQHFQARDPKSQLLGKFPAVQLRHYNVGDQEINLGSDLIDLTYGLIDEEIGRAHV